MGILRNFLDRLRNRGGKSATPGSQAVAVADKLEGEISAVSNKLEGEISTVTGKLANEISAVNHDSQALAEEVQRVRSESEHAREQERRKLAALEQVHQDMEAARDTDHRKLAELESINAGLQAARATDSKLIGELSERIAALEKSRTDIEGSQRQVSGRIGMLEQSRIEMDGRNRKISERLGALEQSRTGIEDAQRQASERVGALEQSQTGIEDAQRQASERVEVLEQSHVEIESAQVQVGERIETLRESQSKTSSAIEQTERQLASLQTGFAEQSKQFSTSLADANSRLDDADTSVSRLEIRMKREREDYLKTFDSVMGRYRKQETRLNWTLFAAVLALLLGAGAGAVLVWDVQKNARILTGMSDDIKTLMNTVEAQQSRVLVPPPVVQSKPVVPVAPPPAMKPEPPPAAQPATREITIEGIPDESAATPVTKPKTMSLSFLSNAQNGGRVTNRQGIRQYQRKDASSFFEENARLDGVVSLDSGVQYRLVKAGSGKSPTANDTVVINFVGTKLDGSVIDETYSKGEPKTVSMGKVMPAWREVLLKMEEGAEFELYLPANQATRRSVRNRGITGFEPHMYLIELIQVVKGEGAEAAAKVN